MKVISKSEILSMIEMDKIILSQEEAFVAHSEGQVVTPPVGHLSFSNPPGDCHIKYGMINGDDTFLVKIAQSFYDNPKIGLPSSNGLMMTFSAKTGAPVALLNDEGYLTDLRTAVAGLIAAKYLAVMPIKSIGIIGTGTQARLQLQLLKHITNCLEVYVWGRSQENAMSFKSEMTKFGFNINIAQSPKVVAENCDLIITTTPSKQPILQADWIRPGTHITAVGADATGKQELDSQIFAKADIRIVDSISQCVDHGDSKYAIDAGIINENDLIELGQIIKNPAIRRKNNQQISIADLTGIIAQDIQIAKCFIKNYSC